MIVKETAPNIPNPTFTADIEISGFSNLVKHALTAGKVNAGRNAAIVGGSAWSLTLFFEAIFAWLFARKIAKP